MTLCLLWTYSVLTLDLLCTYSGQIEGDGAEDSMEADIGTGHKFADLKLTRTLSQDITNPNPNLRSNPNAGYHQP